VLGRILRATVSNATQNRYHVNSKIAIRLVFFSNSILLMPTSNCAHLEDLQIGEKPNLNGGLMFSAVWSS
jgi:hypothetical protein